MRRKSELSIDEMCEATRDLLAICKRDDTIFYLPGEVSVDGSHPVCGDEMNK